MASAVFSAKGSGVWYFIGKTITFKEHADAFAHFGERDNEAMCRAAAAAGYDTVKFSAHHDHTNYPCDKAGGYPYMNIHEHRGRRGDVNITVDPGRVPLGDPTRSSHT